MARSSGVRFLGIVFAVVLAVGGVLGTSRPAVAASGA